jgi:hypothetical protein
MSVLSRTYMVLDLSLSDKDAKKLEHYLLETTQRYASLLYRQSVQVEIHYWEGSFKSVWVVAGSICLAIGAYGTFRSGIDYVIKDGKAVTDYIRESLVKDGLPEDKILEIRRRQCTPDTIRRLYRRIDSHKAKKPAKEGQSKYDREGDLIRSRAAKVVLEELDHKSDVNAFLQSLDKEYKSPYLLDIERSDAYPDVPFQRKEPEILTYASDELALNPAGMGSGLIEPRVDFSMPQAPWALKGLP